MKKLSLPTKRPVLIKNISTHDSESPISKAITSESVSTKDATFVSCSSETFLILVSWSLKTAARSKFKESEALFNSVFKLFSTTSVLPSKNNITCWITLSYSSLSAYPVQGATHLFMWNSRQGFASLPVIVLVHDLYGNNFFSKSMLRRKAPTVANGPKYLAPSLLILRVR